MTNTLTLSLAAVLLGCAAYSPAAAQAAPSDLRPTEPTVDSAGRLPMDRPERTILRHALRDGEGSVGVGTEEGGAMPHEDISKEDQLLMDARRLDEQLTNPGRGELGQFEGDENEPTNVPPQTDDREEPITRPDNDGPIDHGHGRDPRPAIEPVQGADVTPLNPNDLRNFSMRSHSANSR